MHQIRDDGVIVLRPEGHEIPGRTNMRPRTVPMSSRPTFDPTADAVHSADEERSSRELVAWVEDERVSQAQAADLAWNAMSEVWGVPVAASGLVPPLSAAIHHARIIRESGGVVEACVRYRSLELSARDTEALFAPFDLEQGLFTDSHRAAIVTALLRNPQFADRLWAGALRYATQG